MHSSFTNPQKQKFDVMSRTRMQAKQSNHSDNQDSARQFVGVVSEGCNVDIVRIHTNCPKEYDKSLPKEPTLNSISMQNECVDYHEKWKDELDHARQIIAVSVSKSPSVFFNLARKFLVNDEECDLSALEGAIVSAIDAAHLLERAKIAIIKRIQTSYVTVDPKKRRDHDSTADICEGCDRFQSKDFSTTMTRKSSGRSHALNTLTIAAEKGREIMHEWVTAGEYSSMTRPSRSKNFTESIRRARIVITVKRTDDYVKWLENNSIQDLTSCAEDNQVEPTS